MAKTKLFPVPFYIGDGSDRKMLYVSVIAEFPRDADNLCAFCHGDPCAERSGPETEIAQYYERAKSESWRTAETCPLCGGRPS